MSVDWVLGENLWEFVIKLTDTFSYLMNIIHNSWEFPCLSLWMVRWFFISRSQVKPLLADDVSSRTSANRIVLMEKNEKARQRPLSKSTLEARWGDRTDTKRDTMLFKNSALPLTRSFLVKLYQAPSNVWDLPSRFLTFPIYTETLKVPT